MAREREKHDPKYGQPKGERERGPVATKHQGSMTASARYEAKDGAGKKHSEELKNQTVKIPFDNLQEYEHVARVRVSGGATLNMDNFESVRVDVMIELPCPPTKKAINDTYVYASEWVENRLHDEVKIAQDSDHFRG